MNACKKLAKALAAALVILSSCLAFAQTNSSTASSGTPRTQRDVSISSSQMTYVKESMERLFLGRVQFDPKQPQRLAIQLNTGVVSLLFSAQEQKIRVEGPVGLVDDIANLVSALGTQAPGQPLRVLPLNDNAQASLSQFIRTRGSGAPTRAQLASAPQQNGGATLPPLNPPSVSNPVNPLGAPQPQQERSPTLPLPQFEGVQIEMLPEIDAIILRGRDQQLSDLTDIIRQLDEASRLTRNEIEVVPLQHAGSESLAKLVTSTLEKLIGTRQGRVTVTPLGKPNALLLIGWGEAIGVVKELITKLDQPAPADSQFTVIQLKHAVASEVQTQLQAFFRNREGLAPVIQSMIDSRTNAIIVQASPRDLQEIKLLIEQIDLPRGSAMQQARVFQIKNSLASDIAKSLQQALTTSTTGRSTSVQLLDQEGQPIATSGILGTSQITVNDRNNSIVVSSSPENLPLIEKLIEQLDTPGMVAKIKIFPVKNGDANSLVETLRSLLPTPAPGTQGGAQLSNAPDDSSMLPLRFTVDTRGNNIIVVGSEGDLKIVEALILRLDESDKMQRKSIVYQLKNSPAVDVALAINEFLRSKRQVEIAAPGVNNPFEQLEREVVVVPEPVQNKLILSATPRYYDEISRLIEQLDQQPPQVMIQVMIAEITLGNTDEFGIEMGLQDSVLFDRSLLGGLVPLTRTTTTSTPAGVVTETSQDVIAATNIPGFNFNSTEPLGNSGSGRALASSNRVGNQGISNFSVGRTNDQLGFGGLVLSASSENVSFLLRALQASRRLEILSRPQVLTLDNQQAFIQVGQRVPRIVSSVINQNGAQSSVALENVGLIIGVTPRISPEGNVVMEIDAEKSKLGPEAEGIPISISNNGTVIRSPRVDTITAQATVSAGDGETIILGGLISRSTRTEHRQVPWLGSLPILKHLFSFDSNEFLRTELLIIMTPHVVRSQGDMERLKQAEFARMSWCEADVFQVHGDVYPATDLSADLMRRDDWNVVYPDVDPRGASAIPSTGTEGGSPSIGPPVSADPTNFPVGSTPPRIPNGPSPVIGAPVSAVSPAAAMAPLSSSNGNLFPSTAGGLR